MKTGTTTTEQADKSRLVIRASHTPGPWHTPDNWVWVHAPNGYQVATANYTQGTIDLAKANARLIAAAPEMFEALKQSAELLGMLARPDGRPESLSHIWARCVELEARGRAAIAKATGEQSPSEKFESDLSAIKEAIR